MPMPARARRTARLPACLCALAVLALAAPAAAAPAPAAAHRPVVFVHGYNADPGVWGSLRQDLTSAGYDESELFSWGYDTSRSVNEDLAGQLAAYVAQVRARTGADRVDLVAHSFGSLVTRWYVKYGGGAPAVAHWASLAGPNHGTLTAWACAAWSQACRDMTPGSYVADRLAAGDETPGPVAYATWWSNCDEVINPDASVALTGAANHAAGCLAHNDLLSDDGVSRGVQAFLRTA
ncbi:esterase/lipase family protein [Streptomyces sp. NPDC058308]|uniref:esterase/lipase family protein n=1 Tax=Streptomyces sp. NPDC058308 TaxID=3346440 RepID=UPI0036EFC268